MSKIKTWREMWAEDKKQHGCGASSQLSFADREIDELRAALAADDDRFEWLQENVDSAITRLNIDLGMQAANQ